MTALFADTFYYLALLNPTDRAHPKASAFTKEFDGNLVTTGWVLTELADAMSDPANRRGFLALLHDLQTDPRVMIIPPSANLLEAGLELYSKRLDKAWPLTDCISFLVMREQNLKDALTADRHFEQAGFNALLK
jgi:uncharacterized protein